VTRRLLALVFVSVGLAVGLLAQAPARGGRIAGQVTDDAHRPVRDALVMIAGTDITLTRVTETDAGGKFVFEGVPSGHVLIVAGKPAYLAGLYGAARAGRPGKVVAVGADRTTDLAITLDHGAAVAGRVLDGDGKPIAGMRVRVLPRRLVGGRIVLGGDLGEPAIVSTDETGAYRVFELPPGDYLIGIAPRVVGAGDTQLGGRPENPAPADLPSAQGAVVGYAPVFYPGTSDPAAATVVTVGTAVDRVGLDVHTSLVRMGRLDGVLAGIDGVMPPHQIQIRPQGWTTSGSFLYTQTTRAGADGRFTFTNVPPGAYTVVARTLPPPPDPNAAVARRAPPLWALADLTMTGPDTRVILRWQGALTVTGHVTFAGLTHPPDDITVRIGLRATPASAGAPVPDPVPVDASGGFTLGGVLPGEYWLVVQVPANPATQFADWIQGSAMIDGHDAFDEPFAVGTNLGTPDIPVVLTRETQQIDGAVRDGTGHPVVDCPVVVFSTDRRLWFPQSRHIAVRRTDTTGGWLFNLGAGLPPGEYFVSLAPDLGPGEQFDPTILADLASSARRVTVAPGGSQSLQLRLNHSQ
jgi:hypothetical protein